MQRWSRVSSRAASCCVYELEWSSAGRQFPGLSTTRNEERIPNSSAPCKCYEISKQHGSGLCRFHGNDLAKWRRSCFGGCPQHGEGWRHLREGSAQVGEEDECLWLDAFVRDPLETRTEICTAPAYRRECHWLSCLIRLHSLHLGVEIQNMDETRLLTGKDRADLCLEETELAGVDRSGAVDGNHNLANTFRDEAGQVESVPDVATVGTCPAVIRFPIIVASGSPGD